MSTLDTDILDAFKRIGANEDDAKALAVEMAKINPDQLATKSDLFDLKIEISKLKGEFTLIKWMISFLLAVSVAVLFVVIKLSSK